MTETFQYKLGSQNETELLACLLPDEVGLMQRFVQQADQLRFLYARANLRRLLANKLACAAQDININVEQHGKLAVKACPVNFNVAHSGDWVVIALDAEHQVGIDVELMQRKVNIMDLSARFFHPQEAAALQALPQQIQLKSFFYTWVCKEAVIKCDGRGLALGLENFAVNVDPNRESQLLIPPADSQLSGWQMRVWQCAPGYYCALATARNG